jgi:hypothetical protein
LSDETNGEVEPYNTYPLKTDSDKARAVIEAIIFKMSDQQISERTGMKLSEVKRIRGNAEAILTADSLKNIDDARRSELYKLDMVEREAYEALQFSKNPEIISEEREEEGGQFGDKTSRMKRMRYRTAEAAYMKVILECIDQRCKILGLHAAKKIDITVEYNKYVVETVVPVMELFCEQENLPLASIERLGGMLEAAFKTNPFSFGNSRASGRKLIG